MDILNSINSPEDLQQLSYQELAHLSSEIRDFLIEKVSANGGHLASNLGAVELTIALERIYDSSRDRLVFDVGHQSYVHKILTGRRDNFDALRQYGGLSGFPKPAESQCDAFIAGHASNSVSVALGMARARSLLAEEYEVAAIIGDGALSGGLAYEGLSNAGLSGEPMVVILNDNEMSISQNVGGIARVLSRLRVKSGYLEFKRNYRRVMRRFNALYLFIHHIKETIKRSLLPSNTFSEMGFYYLGPVDGHDIRQLESALIMAKEMHRPVLLHVKTKKGKGYPLAEADPKAYHGVSSFDPKIGVKKGCDCYSDVFGAHLCRLARENNRIVAITAAMCDGTGLSQFEREFPARLIDVGIAEGHAVSMAAGLAKQGVCPVFAVYSSFLQRGYDMLIHDVAILKLHVVLAVDRAGLVGADGETHHGVFDLSFLRSVPHMAILCPSSFAELQLMLDMAINRINIPVAVRYPRGCEGRFKGSSANAPVVTLGEGDEAAIVVYGDMINPALDALDILKKQNVEARIVKLNIINPLDIDSILENCAPCRAVVVAEEVCDAGCVGHDILAARRHGVRIINLGSGVVAHGTVPELL
ncbi:MAG: 1-deoxy-D-xylulose-5-phosphate synthase, partial [Anaerolineaceae bacterium]|nr:1-deoxy-D-xylulose-5-phosphate synthase [Anaerolineaceae bacterium]